MIQVNPVASCCVILRHYQLSFFEKLSKESARQAKAINMSFRIRKTLLTREQNKLARKLCSVQPIPTNFNKYSMEIRLFKTTTDSYLLPLGLWKTLGLSRPVFLGGERMSEGEFTGTLLEETEPVEGRKTVRDQQTVFALAKKRLERDGVCMLSLHTGFGKTCLGVCLAARKKKKALIVCKSDKIKRQWVEAVQKFTNHSVEIVKGKKIPKNVDFCIMGPKKVLNFEGDLSCFGTVVVDECHQICTKVFSDALFRLEPETLIGLSATPDRIDGLGEILPPFFGDKPIIRKEVKDFTVYKIVTGYRPSKRFDKRGNLVWSHIIKSLAENTERQEAIAKVLKKPTPGKTIVLGKRKEELRELDRLLRESGESTTLFIENKKEYDKNARFILSTVGKGGVGLDDPKITVVALVSDCIDVRQFEGRARVPNSIIYDFVDCFGPLERHSEEREEWYLDKGATIVEKTLKEMIKN
ncbi:putative superfamily II helicase [Brazilian marseillevirus]|uniref:putative superfamily II helicase n=1 Tax=Brazilian marseillevirus TaxID=1813599 RepID=UPI000785CFA3|nr:putative superfamily II helicase [Brazilian marseillevirus]AMQ10831.1 putative superfamily II helicase [Brazilian marseillevirus]